MKKNLLLIPIALTTLTPMISMVGCGDPDTPEPPEPENYIVLDDFAFTTHGSVIESTKKFFVKENTSYYFKIDTTKWQGSRSASDYDGFEFYIAYSIDGDFDYSCMLNNDFEILIDGKLLDENLWRLDDSTGNQAIWIEPDGLQQILNGNDVIGHLHATHIFCDPTDECYFELYANSNT